jgi:hypothetical protein
VGAAGHHGVPVAFGEVGIRRGQRDEVAAEDRQRRLALEDHAGVDDVLRGRAPVHPAPVLARQALDLAHHGHDGVGGPGEVALHRVQVEQLDAGGSPDRLGGLRRDQAQLGLGSGQGGLDVEPALQHRPLVEDRAHLRRRELIAEELVIDQVARHRAAASVRR